MLLWSTNLSFSEVFFTTSKVSVFLNFIIGNDIHVGLTVELQHPSMITRKRLTIDELCIRLEKYLHTSTCTLLVVVIFEICKSLIQSLICFLKFCPIVASTLAKWGSFLFLFLSYRFVYVCRSMWMWVGVSRVPRISGRANHLSLIAHSWLMFSFLSTFRIKYDFLSFYNSSEIAPVFWF